MNLNFTLPTIPIKFIVFTIGGIIGISVFVRECNKPKNVVVKKNTAQADVFDYKTKYLKDSVHYIEVEAKLAESQKTILKLQDSLIQAVAKNSGIKPSSTASWKQETTFTNLDGNYIDSLKGEAIKNSTTIDSLIAANSNLIPVPRAFKVENKWVQELGIIKKDKVTIDSLKVFNKPYVIFGETRKKFLGIPVGRPTITAVVGDENPFTVQTEPKVYTHQPSNPKISLVIGGGVTYVDGRIVAGPQLTLGYKIF